MYLYFNHYFDILINIFSGLIPRKVRELSEKYSMEIPRSTLLSPEKQQNVRTLLRDYYVSLSKHLIKDNNEIIEFEKQNRRILQTKGELNQERKDKLEQMRIGYEKLLAVTQNFAEILDEDMPQLTTESANKQEEVTLFNHQNKFLIKFVIIINN